VFDQFVAVFLRNRPLQILYIPADELRHLARFKTNHVIVVRTLIQFVNRMTPLEVMPGYETDGLELRQDPIHGREANLLTTFLQLAVNLLSTEMSLRTLLQQVKDFPAGRGGL